MSFNPSISMRITLAKPSRGVDDVRDALLRVSNGDEVMRKNLELGLMMLTTQVQKERFTGKGPFPVADKKLGVVSGRLRRDLHSEKVTITPGRYQGRIGSVVEYFAAHELGFNGKVNVPAHTRKAYTTRRGYSVLEQSVRSHSRTMKVAKRAPLRTGIEEHSARILGAAANKAMTLIFSKGGKP